MENPRDKQQKEEDYKQTVHHAILDMYSQIGVEDEKTKEKNDER